jgi:hypothetical protein
MMMGLIVIPSAASNLLLLDQDQNQIRSKNKIKSVRAIARVTFRYGGK